MEENILLDNNLNQTPQRSQFLKVLCILSFIMCGISFLSGIWSIYQSSPEAMQKNIEQIRTVNPEMADKMEDQFISMQDNPYSKVAPYLAIMYTLLSFLGVMMMWNFVKKGFYIYAIAEILPYTGFVFMGKNSLSMMGPPGSDGTVIAMAMMVIMVVIDVVFVALYAKNLKEMTK